MDKAIPEPAGEAQSPPAGPRRPWLDAEAIAVFARYTAAGAVGTLAHYAVLLCLVEAAHAPPTLGTTIGFATGAGVNYALNRKLTFRSTQKHSIALTRFLSVAAAGMVLNGSIVAAGVRWLRVHYLIAQVAATGAVLIFTFLLNRAWTFRVERS